MTALIISSFLILIAFLLLAAYFAFIWECRQNCRPNRIIYHGTNLAEQGEKLQDIISRYISDTSTYNLVEPGAGMGKVAEYLGKRLPWQRIVAIEIGPVLYYLGIIRAIILRSKLEFIKKDIFDYPIPSQSVVYCYLSGEMLTKLYKEGRLNGQLVICLTFSIDDLKPNEEITLRSWQKRLLVYDLREKKQNNRKYSTQD